MLRLIRSASLVVLAAGLPAAFAADGVPYSQATVTRLQNQVSLGMSAERARRPAQTGDVIKSSNYLLTDTDSRAELKYEDGSLVRIGQNTVFTFEADTRTLTLERGSLLFYIPKGRGGGTIRTASLTASITGTIGKVADNMIAILEGEVTLVPGGEKVGAGQFARRNADGSITLAAFDPSTALGGKLMEFGGPIAEFDSNLLIAPPAGTIVRDIMHDLEQRDRLISPGALDLFDPQVKPKVKKEEKSEPAPAPRPTPRGGEPTPRPTFDGLPQAVPPRLR